MTDKYQTGKKGEKLVVSFLRRQGYRILETNWRYGHKEIDILAMDGDFLVVVEVKTRSTDYFGYPEEAVNKKKQRFLAAAVNAYVEEHQLSNEIRFDVVAVIITGNTRRIYHIKDAFFPGL